MENRYDPATYDLTGRQFGKLTVIGLDHSAKGATYWRCRCECGGECVTRRYNLTSGKTKSCGCLRGKSENITRGRFHKVDIDEKGMQWIIRHYCHTKNADIKEKYGLTDGWLHRFARKNGLIKTRQFVRKCQRNATDKAKESHLRNNTYPPKGYRIPGADTAFFKKGMTPEKVLGKRKNRQRIEKCTASLARTRALEKTRVRCGLPQKTKLRVVGYAQAVYQRRYYLKKVGYTTENGWDFYYDENTHRTEFLETTSGRMTFSPKQQIQQQTI